MSCVEDTKVVVSGSPFAITRDPVWNPSPETVRSVAGALETCTGMEEGETARIVGAMMSTVRVAVVPPPGAGEKTITWADPVDAMSDALKTADNWVGETRVVERSDPFQRTTELETNPDPLHSSVCAGPPPAIAEGVTEVNVGAGLLIVKFLETEVPPPGEGLKTVMEFCPAVVSSAVGTAADNEVEEAKVVASACPFHRATLWAVKPEPLRLKVNPEAPAFADDGEMDARTGNGCWTSKNLVAEVPPPGAGLNTVMLALSGIAIRLAGTVAESCVDET